MEYKQKITFLVPTLGDREEEISRLFESLKHQSFTDFNVVVAAQGGFDTVQKICSAYSDFFSIKYLPLDNKGLSKARNGGLPFCDGEIIVLSDDDCWYPENATKLIVDKFSQNEIDIALSQIYDKPNEKLYKQYGLSEQLLTSSFQLLSRSSIEISFRNHLKEIGFDENFGVGAKFVCCEEIDFLLNAYKNGARIKYFPEITVYHIRKALTSTKNQIIAKGALYSKNFGFFVSLLICFRDLIKKKENNFSLFFKGYRDYKNQQ